MNSNTEAKKICGKKKENLDFSSFIPNDVNGMIVLDRDMFNSKASFLSVKCESASVGKIQSAFRHVLLNRKNFRRVLTTEEYGDNVRLILLNPSIKSVDQFDDSQKDILKCENAELIHHELTLSYDSFTLDEILRKVLSKDVDEIVSSFETVGHIAHINLKEHLLKYKYLIGEVLLDKNPNIKTVVNKTNSIEETFRFFHMELLAGEDKMYTTVQEHGCLFEFDYSKVYWNSRLQTEHQRIVTKLNPKDVVFDVFAGVGPFAIPAAKKGCIVHANDLNEVSYNSLKKNAKLNKVLDKVTAYNLDGKEFLAKVVVPQLDESNLNRTYHIVMNLPAIAPEFLCIFRETYFHSDVPSKQHDNIMVHCYCFSKSKTPLDDAAAMISKEVGFDVSNCSESHFVRRVAPNKVMICLSFKLFPIKSSKITLNLSQKRPVDDVLDKTVTDSKRISLDV